MEPVIEAGGGMSEVELIVKGDVYTVEALKCRDCDLDATQALRSGLEDHPICDGCAEWWGEDRLGPLSEVAHDYVYLKPKLLARRSTE